MDCFHVAFIISVVTSVSYSNGLIVIIASHGDRATLPCELEDLPSDNIISLYWRKNGTTVYSQTTNGEVGHDRYSVIDASSLVIPNVTKSDAGNYSCKIVSPAFANNLKESDITQLYVTDVAVSHCQDNRDGECSCFINGSNITSLECSASGFPHPPMITWDVGQVTYRSSTLDLTKFAENFTIVCKAKDRSVDSMDNKTVCVYYMPESPSTMSTEISPVVTSSTSSVRVFLALMILFIILFIVSCVALLYMNHKRTKGSLHFHWPNRSLSRLTSTPKSQQANKRPLEPMTSYDAGDVNVLKDSWKNSKGSNVGVDVSKDNGPISVIEDSSDVVDFYPKDGNKEVSLTDEAAGRPALPLVGQVLLDDLRSATQATEEAMKKVIVALLSKRREPYEDDQSHIEPSITVQSSFMPTPLQNSLKLDPGLAFVHMVLDDLDQILDVRDRDECEILITKPGLRDITDESQIPTYQGNRVIQQSRLDNSYQSPTQASMTSSMASSMVAYTNTPLASVLENELRKKPTERTAMRNSISQIILHGMTAGYPKRGNQERLISRSTGGLPDTSMSVCVDIEEQDDEVSRLVTFWMNKTAKLDTKVKKNIKRYLFPLEPRHGNIHESLGADSGIHSSKERDDIPPTAKLLDSNG